MNRRSPRSVITVISFVAATVLLAGCFSVESTFTINDDGTVDVSLVTLIDTDQLEELSSLIGEDAGELGGLSGDALLDEMMGGEDPCGDLTNDLTDYETSTREIDEDGQVGVECTVEGIPFEEISGAMSEDDSTFTITQEGGDTTFSATLEGVDELTSDPETSEMTDMLGVGFDELFQISFNVSAPGSLGDNNATSTDGSTATWDVTPDADFVTGGDAVMTAEWSGSSSSSSSSTLWIILGIIAAVVIVGAIVFLAKRGKKDDTSGGDTSVAAVAPMSPPPAPGAPTSAAPAGFDAPPSVATPPPAAAPPTFTPPPPPSDTPPPPPPA